MSQQHLVKIFTVFVFVGATFSAKPMYQPILEETADFLVEIAPEIAKVGGSLAIILTQDSRSENQMMEPPEDETLTNSQKVLSFEAYKESIKDAAKEADKHDFCDIF